MIPVDDRRYPPRPILGVGAIILNRGCVLLVERGREPLKGYWSIPGGVVESGERLEAAVRREVLEETGLHVNPVSVAGVFERILLDSNDRAEYHYVLIDYMCDLAGGELRAASDASRAAWVAREDLPGYLMTEGTRPLIERVFESIAHD